MGKKKFCWRCPKKNSYRDNNFRHSREKGKHDNSSHFTKVFFFLSLIYIFFFAWTGENFLSLEETCDFSCLGLVKEKYLARKKL